MGSSRQKGDRRERKAGDIYTAAGYRVERATAGGFQSPDFWDAFDLLALAEGSHLVGVQVKSNEARGIRGWLVDVRPIAAIPGVRVEYAVAVDGEGWRLVRPDDDTYTTVYDERKDPDVGPYVDTDKNLGEGLTDFLAAELDG